MFKKVFISYASEDINQALSLYSFLEERGYEPWLDKKKLKVGDNWDLKIRRALQTADFVIFLLSSSSINKRGYVQREFKLALKYLEEKLFNDSYIFPVLLNDCEIPEQINNIQWIKYNEANFLNEILEALNRQRKIYFSTISKEILDLNNSYITENLELIPQLSRHIHHSIEYPVFAKNKFWDNTLVNETIKAKANEIRNSLLNYYFESPQYFENGHCRNCQFYLNYSVVGIAENYLSVLFTEEQFLGGAHPNTYFHTLNFLFNPDYLINPKSHVSDEEIRKIVS